MADKDELDIPEEEVFTPYSGVQEGEVTPRHLLDFAKVILLVVAVMYVLAAISELWVGHNAVYEACKITLPSIATLVIGYYFGSSK